MNAPKKLLDCYDKAVRAIIRYIVNIRRREPTSKHAKDLHILMTKERVEYKICILTWKVVHLGEPKMICRLLPTNEKDVKVRSSRDTSKVCMNKKIATTITSKRFSNATKIFNDLPKNLRDIDKIDSFKKQLKTFLFRKAYGD